MADILEILDRLEAPRRRELESQSGLLQAGNILLGQRIQPNRFESRTETFLAPLIQALAGSSLRELGQKGIQEEIGGFRSAVSEAFSQPDRRQALTELSQQPGFDSVSNIVAALDIQNQEREREMEALRRKSQLQQELEPKIDESFASVLAPRLGVSADFLVGRPQSILSKIKAPSGPSTIVKNIIGGEGSPLDKPREELDPILAEVTSFTGKDRDTAFKEANQLTKERNQKELLQTTFQELIDTPSARALLPKTRESATFSTASANLIGIVSQAISGVLTDEDIRRQIDPFIPTALDPLPVIEEKFDKIIRYIDINKPPTFLLDRAGTSKKFRAEYGKPSLVMPGADRPDRQLGGQPPAESSEKQRLRARVKQLKAQGLTEEQIRKELAGG